MINLNHHDPAPMRREKLVFRYTNALERGDFDTITIILQQAVSDPVLEHMLMQVNDALAAELPSIPEHVSQAHPATHLSLTERVRLLIGDLSQSLAVGAVTGIITGVVAGGLGSRLAMRIAGLIENPGSRVMFTQSSGALVGSFTIDGTIALLMEGAFFGVVGGILYMALRQWLPGSWRRRGLIYGLILLVVNGSLLFEGDNIDFRRIGIPWLNVLMFAALPVIFGLMAAYLVERFERLRNLKPGDFGTQLALVGLMSGMFLLFVVGSSLSILNPEPDGMSRAQLSLFVIMFVLSGAGVLVTALARQIDWLREGRKVRHAAYAILLVACIYGLILNIQALSQILQ